MTDPYLMWVAGSEQIGSAELIPVEDPATGEVFAHCHAASASDVDHTVTVAHAAFKSGIWSKASRHHRADVLDACAALLSAALPELIALEVRQTGRPIREMNAQVPSLTKWFKYYAGLLRVAEAPVLPTTGKLHNFVTRAPLGVVALVTPFNHPLLIAVKKLAPALAAGNAVVLKPSELTPLTSLRLGRILRDAGVPDGVFSVLPGYGAETGEALVGHPLVRKVDVTGGTAAGRAIGRIVGGNLARYTAELGGKAPLVVFESADVQMAVNGIAFGSFIASGQTCIASARIIVDNRILPELMDKLKMKTLSIRRRMGAPSNPETSMGPLISMKQLRHVEELIDDVLAVPGIRVEAGCHRMHGMSRIDGTDFSQGYYMAPTIISAQFKHSILRSRIWKEEVFGPVIVVVGFDTEKEAIEMANDSEFGLGASIWTQDLAQAFRVSEQIEAGITWVNTHHRNDPSSPWGGAKSSSGVGSENGIDAYHAYTTTKSTIVNYASTEEALATEDWFQEGTGTARYG
ncbi:aldehyde dehydrogenase [Xylariaceae sp. FL0662B]|nr:aldehyde dehydrogenase [Xylariaceae sp. FL0662B]